MPQNGRYGDFGGQYIPETLMNEIHRLEEAYEYYSNNKEFIEELDRLNREYAGRRGEDDKGSGRSENIF